MAFVMRLVAVLTVSFSLSAVAAPMCSFHKLERDNIDGSIKCALFEVGQNYQQRFIGWRDVDCVGEDFLGNKFTFEIVKDNIDGVMRCAAIKLVKQGGALKRGDFLRFTPGECGDCPN